MTDTTSFSVGRVVAAPELPLLQHVEPADPFPESDRKLLFELRKDLPDMIGYARSLGMRVNLITNGIRAAEPGYASSLAAAGLASAQVSLEAGEPGIHDAIVRRPGAWAKTVAGVGALRRAGMVGEGRHRGQVRLLPRYEED